MPLLVVFKVYDVRGDGYLTADELYEVLKTVVGKHLSDKHLMDIAEQTVTEADLDKDGKISFDEFCHVRRTVHIYIIANHLLFAGLFYSAANTPTRNQS